MSFKLSLPWGEKLPVQDMRKVVSADFRTGVLTWNTVDRDCFDSDQAWKKWNSRFAGKRGFRRMNNGTLCGTFRGLVYSASQLVWALDRGYWPAGQVRHHNGDRSDCRLVNLYCPAEDGPPARREQPDPFAGVQFRDRNEYD